MSANTNPYCNHRPDNSHYHPHYLTLLLACAVIIAGLALMTGEGSSESSFCSDIFSQRRVVVAPAICLLGYLMIVVAIIRKK